MKYQSYDLQNLDNHSRSLIVDNEIDALIDNKVCSICKGNFIGREERDNATLSGKNPLTFAHDFCWESK